MSLLDALALEPFMVNQPLLNSFLTEPDSFEVYLADRGGLVEGSGVSWDPYDASTEGRFDALMNCFPPNTTIHLAAGLYKTNGYANGVSGGWRPKRGQRIVGGGIDTTTLKLTGASTANKIYFAIGADDETRLDGFEVSDLTVDCNLEGQTGSTALAAGAIKVYGSGIRIRRVRAINFGTLSTAQKGVVLATAGAFPGAPEPVDCVVEDCVVEQPSWKSVRETCCIALIGGEDPADGRVARHRSCVVRHCVVNCAYVNEFKRVSELTYSTPTATVKTWLAHERSANQWVVITGALEKSENSGNFNGSFQIGSAPDSKTFTVTPDSPTSPVDPTGDMKIDFVAGHRVAIDSISVSLVGGDYVAELTSKTSHNRVPGQNVVLNNVLVDSSLNNSFNQSFEISEVSTRFKLKFSMGSTDPGTPVVTDAFIGVDFTGIAVDGGVGTIVERNRVHHAEFGLGLRSIRDGIVAVGCPDLTIWDNHFHGVLSGVDARMGQISGGTTAERPARTVSSLTRGGTGNKTATLTADDDHGLSSNDFVVVSGAEVQGNKDNPFNGVFKITVVSSTVFQYQMESAPADDADSSPTPVFGSLQQPSRAGVSLTYATEGSDLIATFTTDDDPQGDRHGLEAGQAVAILARISGDPENEFTGVFEITEVPSPMTFKYKLNGDPGANADSSPNFGAMGQLGRIVVENNVIELIRAVTDPDDPPVGVRLERTASQPPRGVDPPYVYKQAMIRRNLIRHVDGGSDPSEAPLAMLLANCEAAVVEENTIQLDVSNPVRIDRSGSVKFFSNQKPSGELIQGHDTGKEQDINELTTDAELGALLST